MHAIALYYLFNDVYSSHEAGLVQYDKTR